MGPVTKLAQAYIGQATRNPVAAPRILRTAAATFAGLSRNPMNAKRADKLQAIAFDFVNAAARAQAQKERPLTTDDFTDLLNETAEAYDESSDDPIETVARRREIHQDRTTEAPHVSIAPASFNADATLGRSVTIQSFFGLTDDEINKLKQDGIVEQETVAFWQGVKRETQAMCVDVALVNPPPPGRAVEIIAPENVRAFGVVEYGSDGNKTEVEFDIGQGQRFNVPGNYIAVRVKAGVPRIENPALGIPDPTAPIVVGASIGPFAATSSAPLLCTRFIDFLAASVLSPFIPIPLKAVLLLPPQSDLAAGETATLEFYGWGGGTTPITTAIYSPVVSLGSQFPIPIARDIAFVRVRNNGATLRNFRLVFQLSL
jgi:hypothetical protein